MSAKLCPQCGTRYEGDNRFCTLDGATLVLENPSDNLTGNLLADRYLVDRKLGEGGMGEVYLAEHIRMKRKVAVKVMRAWLTKDPAAISRFHREAENASQITHPNVAGVYDFGETSRGAGLPGDGVRRGRAAHARSSSARRSSTTSARRTSSARRPTRWPPRTRWASCTATSSPTT